MKLKQVNLCFFLRNSNKEVILGLKKRGFGAGKYDGCGGKVEPNETILEGIIRESKEEFGLTPTNIYSVGKLYYHYKNPKYKGTPMENLENHVFIATEWTGDLIETEEMKPKWFTIEDGLPFDQMWCDTEIWFKYLQQHNFNTQLNFSFYFDENDNIESYENNSTTK